MNFDLQQCTATTLGNKSSKISFKPNISENTRLALRIIRSPRARFAENEIEFAPQAYSDEHLSEIASEGFNAIWVRVQLRDIITSSLFPDMDPAKEKQLQSLRDLTAKAKRHGIKVFLYLCEPRGFKVDDPFWEKHPHLKGQHVDFDFSKPGLELYYALCTSTPEVKAYLEESTYNLFSAIPDLGGFFCITASEFHTHCYSHFPGTWQQFPDPNVMFWTKGGFQCQRCKDRTATDVVSEVITLLNRGTKRASAKADVIAWTWSWSIIEESPQAKLISSLPDDVIIMSDFERGGLKSVCGDALHEVEEYSFSHVPPSDRFLTHAGLCKHKGNRFMAKMQLSATHEFASVPYIPVPFLLAQKFESLREMQVHGFVGCWVFGGNLSPMTKLAILMSGPVKLSIEQGVKEIALKEFGTAYCDNVSKAWQHFSKAWLKYPFSIPFLYYGPMNYATAYPFSLAKKEPQIVTSCWPLPRDVDGKLSFITDIQTWIQPFGAETIITALRNLLTEWDTGLTLLESVRDKQDVNDRLESEWRLAKHIALSIQSTINILLFHDLSVKLSQSPDAKATEIKKQISKLLYSELKITRQDRQIVAADNRLGYHSEAGCHLFNIEDLDHKIQTLNVQLEKLNS